MESAFFADEWEAQSDMRVLVTGGTGFVGRNLVHLLVEQGHEVTVLHRESSKLIGLPEGISYRIGDVTQADTIQGCCEEMDWVYHVAGEVTWGKKHRDRMFAINVEGSRNIAKEALRAGVKRFIHTSSAAAIGLPRQGVIADENYPFDGDRLHVGYSIAKRQGEEAVLSLVEKGLPAVVVNPTVIIGIRAYQPTFFGAVAKGRLTVAPVGGVNICDVEDVAKGHLLAAEKGKVGERYILGGENLPMLSLFRQIADQAGLKQPIRTVPRSLALPVSFVEEFVSFLTGKEPGLAWDLAKLTGYFIYYSSEKAERELGYQKTPLSETIANILTWENNMKQTSK